VPTAWRPIPPHVIQQQRALRRVASAVHQSLLSLIYVCWPWYYWCWEGPLSQLRQSPPSPYQQATGSETMSSLFRSLRERKRSTTDRPGSSKTSSPSAPDSQSRLSNSGVKATSLPIPLPATSGVLPTNLVMVSPPEGLPAIRPNSDEPELAEAWNAVKDKAKSANTNKALDIVGVSPALRILFYRS
jgi:hypothetical protein